jgi:predicted RNA-binding protein YlxR (DUF448 family)
MAAGCFAKSGYFMGPSLYDPRESNPKGFFESPHINNINELILDTIPEEQYISRPIFGHRWTAALGACATFRDAAQPVDRIMEMVRQEPFCFKDPRFSYTLPVWRPYLRNTAFLCVFREPDNTALSLTNEVSNVRISQGIPVYLTHAQALDTWHSIYSSILRQYEKGDRWLFVHYDQILDGSALGGLTALTGAGIDHSFPERKLKRSEAAAVSQRPELKQLYAELCGLAKYRPADHTAAFSGPLDPPPTPETPQMETDASTLNLSAVVLTKNGAGRIEHCLESIVAANAAREIVVCVDQFSTDDTVQIAQRFTPHVYLLRTHGCIEYSLREMAALCSGDLVLRVDDDERLGGAWGDAKTEMLARYNDVTHFWTPRRWIVPPGDRFISSRPWFPDLQLRLFRNDSNIVDWPKKIHDHMIVRGRGLILTDRWIDHYDLVFRSRQERERKCLYYREQRPQKDMSCFYLWEDQVVELSDMAPAALRDALARVAPGIDERRTGRRVPCGRGAEICFSSGGNSDPYKGDGWSLAEPWGTWTEGYRADLILPLKEHFRGGVLATLEANAYVTPDHPRLRVCVACGHSIAQEWLLETSASLPRTFTVPASVIGDGNELRLAFHVVNPASPLELGESDDDRLLGMGFQRLRLDEADRG